jgi:hypothetical protein
LQALKVWNSPISSKAFKKLQLCNFIALNKNDKNSNWFLIQPFIRCIPITFLNYALTLAGNTYWDHVECCHSVSLINFIQFVRDCVALSQQAINKVSSFLCIIKIIHLNFRISIYLKQQFLYFIYQYGFPISLN